MHVTNFVNKIDKKMYLKGSISSIKKPQVPYCKIEIPGDQFVNDQNLMGWLCNLAKTK